MVKLGGDGNYLKTENVNSGDKVEFLSEGEWVESTRFKYSDGNQRVDFFCKVNHISREGKEEKDFRINKTNRDILIKAWGNETSEWIGRKAGLEVENIMVAGKRSKTIFLSPQTTAKDLKKSKDGQEVAWYD